MENKRDNTVDELTRLFKDEQKLVDGILTGTCLTKVEITNIVAALGGIEQMWQMVSPGPMFVAAIRWTKSVAQLDSDLTAILTNLQMAEVGGDEKVSPSNNMFEVSVVTNILNH
jgi:hypothetical protein